jgi:hypothetical protein
MRLDDNWNQIQFNLSDFTRRAYGTNYVETLRVQIHANCRVRRIYFSDRLYTEEELPAEFKLYLPAQVRSVCLFLMRLRWCVCSCRSADPRPSPPLRFLPCSTVAPRMQQPQPPLQPRPPQPQRHPLPLQHLPLPPPPSQPQSQSLRRSPRLPLPRRRRPRLRPRRKPLPSPLLPIKHEHGPPQLLSLLRHGPPNDYFHSTKLH